MTLERIRLTWEEECFLRHWSYEAIGPLWGPATIWCLTRHVSPAHGPYSLARQFWAREVLVGGEGWSFARPSMPFRIPWKDSKSFWRRAELAMIGRPELRGDPRFGRTSFRPVARGTLTRDESLFLRAYYAEQRMTGKGRHTDQIHRHGVDPPRLSPFYELLEDPEDEVEHPADFPWSEFSTRREEVAHHRHQPGPRD